MSDEGIMHFKFKYLQKIVGGFFLLTLIIVIVLITIVARGQRWFQSYARYVSYFENGGGLHVGSDVMMRGLEAGKVKSIGLDAGNRVMITTELYSQHAGRIREGTTAKITKPVVGSSVLEIVLGPREGRLIPVGGTIPSSEEEGAGLDKLIASTTNLVEALKNPDGDLMGTLANVNTATKSLSDAMTKNDTTLKRLLERRDLYDELNSSVAHLNSVLASLDESSPEIRDAITEARRGLEEVNKVILALQKSIFLRGNIEKYLSEDSTLKFEGR